MPAIWEDDNGVIHYYYPPPPPPPPPSQSPEFKQAVDTAGKATTAYQDNPSDANETALNNDWNTVQEMIAEQYRLALSSSDPAKEVAALNQQYGQVFQGGKGATANIYNKLVLPGAQKEAEGETPGVRNANITLHNALDEPDSSSTKGYDVAKADINLHLQILYGNGTDGVYSADQYKAAEAAAAKDFAPTFAPVITGVGTSMQQGEKFTTLLRVLQTETPPELSGVPLTPAQVAALGDLLTPEEKKSQTLILTPGQAQLAQIDPVTLSLLMTAGIDIPELSAQMLEIAKSSPSTFFYLEANGINISVGPSTAPAPGVAQFDLGHGQQLNITIHGKPLTTDQLPPGQGGNGRPSTGQTPSTVLGAYLGSEAASKGSGIVVPGSVAVANLLLGDPNLNLQVTPKTLSNPTTPQLKNLTFLVSQADSARPEYVNSKLSSLLTAAPPPDSKDAAAYFANVIDPFLTTQTNGFFSSDDAVNFWNSSPVIDNAGVGGDPKSSLHAYLHSWLGTLFNNPDDQRHLLTAGGNLKQMLNGAPPGLARMVIPMVEDQVNKIEPQNQAGAISALFDGLSEAVQIADQFPDLSTTANPPKNVAATQVASWLNSLGGRYESFYSLGVGNRLYDDTAAYGYTDLPNELMSYWPTGVLAEDIRNGERDYDANLQKQLGTANYEAFQNNKAQVLNGFFGQFSNNPNIGKPISTSATETLKQAIIDAYGFTPQELAPVTTHNGAQTVTVPSQATNIVNTDLAWIQNQSIPGSTVTILPFMFASSGLANGTEGGVFFDISNPAHRQTRHRYAGRAGTQTEQVDVGPSHVLIDGSAAADALQMDPNLLQHPEESDVKWHYSSYRDFQLSNTAYQNGTIYTLPGNQLGIGPDGAASSATDFHKEFDEVMSDIVGASQVVGLVLAPFTGGVSLAITGSLGLVWGTYQGIEGYDDARSHGQNFSLSNPNTRWEVIGDITVAAGWATLGVAGAEAALTRDAVGAVGTLETATDEAGTLTTVADGPGTLTTVSDESGTVATVANRPVTLDGVGQGQPVLATAPVTVGSNTLKALGVTKKVLEYGNYGLATAQTGKQIESFSADYDHMSFWQRVNALAGIFEATIPFAAEPMNRAAFGGNWSRPGRRQRPDTAVLDADLTSESNSGLEGQPQTTAAVAGTARTPVFVTLADGTQAELLASRAAAPTLAQKFSLDDLRPPNAPLQKPDGSYYKFQLAVDPDTGETVVLPIIAGGAPGGIAPGASGKKPKVPSIPAVRRSIAEASGDVVPPTQTRRPTVATWLPGAKSRVKAAKAGYSADVVAALKSVLRDMPRRQAVATVRALRSFTTLEHEQIRDDLLDNVNPGRDAVYDARLLTQLAALTPKERGQVLANAQTLDTSTAAGQEFLDFLRGPPAHYDEGMKARRTGFLLSFPASDRVQARNIVAPLEGLEATALQNAKTHPDAPPLSDPEMLQQNKLVKELITLAKTKDVPDSLAKLADRHVPASSLQAVTEAILQGGVRKFSFASDYTGAAKALTALIDDRVSAAPAGHAPEIGLMIETGRRTQIEVNGKKLIRTSAYGVVGTALFIRDLRAALGAAKAYKDVKLTVTVVADRMAAPVVQAVLRSIGVKDVTVEKARSDAPARDGLLDNYKPDVLLSVGQSAEHGGRVSLLEQASQRKDPATGAPKILTLAVIDGTDTADTAKVFQATHSISAWNADLGAQAFSGVLLRELGAGKGRSFIPRKHGDAGLGRLIHGPAEVKQAYEAALGKRAVFDDSRLAPGASPGTLTVDAHVGDWYLLNYALAPRAATVAEPTGVPNWRADFTAGYQVASRNTTLDTFTTHLTSAQPPGDVGRLSNRLAYFRYQLGNASRGEQFRTVGGLTFDLAAMGFLGAESFTHSGTLLDVVYAVGFAGTGIRQLQLLKITGIKRLFDLHFRRGTLGRSRNVDDPADAARISRRDLKSIRTRALTYGTSAMATANALVQAILSKHGVDMGINVVADGLFVVGLSGIQVIYARQLLKSVVRPDGKFYAAYTKDDVEFKDMSRWSKIIHVGAKGAILGTFGLGSGMIMFDDYSWWGLGGWGHANPWTAVDLGLNSRSLGNVMQAGGAGIELVVDRRWKKQVEEANSQGVTPPQNPLEKPPYAAFDLLGTYLGAVGIEFGNLATEKGILLP